MRVPPRLKYFGKPLWTGKFELKEAAISKHKLVDMLVNTEEIETSVKDILIFFVIWILSRARLNQLRARFVPRAAYWEPRPYGDSQRDNFCCIFKKFWPN